MSKQFVRYVNNTHIRSQISKNIMPRFYKEDTRGKRTCKRYSGYEHEGLRLC